MTTVALQGVRVVEYGEMVAGPYCGKLLADMGADVIKVEPPGGDPARAYGPFPGDKPHPEKSALFLYLNTSKRGVTLDLSTPAGKALFRKLVRWADILIDNHPTSHLSVLEFGETALRRLNPRLIYTCITPYGRTGPRAHVKGDELTVNQAGGMGNLLPTRSVDTSRAPIKPGGFAAAYHGAITAAMVTMAALIGRGKEGKGRIIDVSMQEVVMGFQRPGVTGARYQGATWSRVPDRPPAMGRMQTSDGYLVLGAIENHHFSAMREMMGNPPWMAGDEWLDMNYRSHHAMEIAPLLDAWMVQHKKDDVHHKLGEKGVPLGPINSVKDLLSDRQYTHRGYFIEATHPVAGTQKYPGWPYRMPVSPPAISRPAPLLGQHNEEVCCHVLGYTPEEYKRLEEPAPAKKVRLPASSHACVPKRTTARRHASAKAGR